MTLKGKLLRILERDRMHIVKRMPLAGEKRNNPLSGADVAMYCDGDFAAVVGRPSDVLMEELVG